MSACRRDGRPDVDEPNTTSGPAARRRGQQGALDLLALGSAFLDEVDPRDRLLDARRERQLPLGGSGASVSLR